MNNLQWIESKTDKHPLIGFFPKSQKWYAEVDRICGTGATIDEAITDLRKRMNEWPNG